jgi:hypothetical protein
MRLILLSGALALTLASAGCETGYGYNAGGGGGLNLSKCQTQALIGGAAGAILGGAVAGRGAKTEGAILGGALGAAGTYGVCRYMDQRSYSQIETGYQTAVSRDRPYSNNWTADDGGKRSLYVPQPRRVGARCKELRGTLTVPDGVQALPPETYCQGDDGVWRPA